MRNFFSALLVLAATSLMAISCSKDGEKGDPGAQGPKGDNGAPGPKGDPGVANVIYSNWLDLVMEEDPDDNVFFGNLSAPKLDKAMLEKAAIKVYVNFNNADDPVIAALPYFELTGVVINYVAFDKTIQIVSNVDAGTGTVEGKKVLQYRYVIIPGGTTANLKLNLDNYAEVKAQLGWKN